MTKENNRNQELLKLDKFEFTILNKSRKTRKKVQYPRIVNINDIRLMEPLLNKKGKPKKDKTYVYNYDGSDITVKGNYDELVQEIYLKKNQSKLGY